ncbi:MAG: M24 family metallopeptidase [Nitrososphaerales archaeon]
MKDGGLPFSTKEYESRIERIQSYSAKRGLSAMIFHGDANENGFVRWISNLEPLAGSTFVIVPVEGEAILISDSVLHGEPMHSLWWMTWIKEVRPSKFGIADLVAATVSALREKRLISKSGSRIGYVKDYNFPESLLRTALPGTELTNCYDDISLIKMPKSHEEIRIMRRTTSIASKAMISGCQSIKEGVSESTIVGIINRTMFEEGAQDVAFYTMVASGTRTHLKHSPPLPRKMKRGDMVFIDLGCSVFGYYSDLCRTLVVGSPSDAQRAVLDGAIDIHEKSSKLLRNGARTNEIAKTAMSLANELGLGNDCHVDGHGIGTSMFDPPSIHLDSDEVLKASTTLAYEPMIFSRRFGTVSFEDNYLIKREGSERLTPCPRRF